MRSLLAEKADFSAVIEDAAAAFPATEHAPGVLPNFPGMPILSRFADPVFSSLQDVRIDSVDILLRLTDSNQTVRLTGGHLEMSKSDQGVDVFGRTAWQVGETRRRGNHRGAAPARTGRGI